MTPLWRLVDRHLVCLHCWDLNGAIPDLGISRKPLGYRWNVSRECWRRNR